MKHFGFLLITLLLATPAWATWPATPIATVTGQSTDGLNASALTSPMNSTGAKVFIAAISRQWNCNAGIQDSLGNTWTRLATSNIAGDGPVADIWWAKAVHTGAGHTFQPNLTGCLNPGGPSYPSIIVQAWNNSENLTGAIKDQVVAGSSSTSSPIAASAILPTTNNQMVLSVAAGAITNSSWGGASGGFTVSSITQGPNAYALALGYLIQTTATSVNPAWTWGGTGTMVVTNVSLFNHIDLGCVGSGLSWTSTPDQPSIQSCVTQAPAGATLNISAGTSPAFTGNPIVWSSKKLTIKGAGAGATILQGQGIILQVGGLSAANFLDVSGITFQTDPTNNITQGNNGLIQLNGAVTGTYELGFHIHHNNINVICCKDEPNNLSSRGVSPAWIYGLMDNNVFQRECSCQLISPEGSSVANDGGFTPWTQPLSLGSYNTLLIESNTFNTTVDGEDVIDSYSGARFVFRANTFNQSHVGWHGTDSGSNRSPVSFEMYGNHFINDSTTRWRGNTMRGGTGVLWGNVYDGSWSGFTMMYYRATILGSGPLGWGFCDGTNWDLLVDGVNECKGLPSGPAAGASTCSVAAGANARFLSTNPDPLLLCRGAVTGTCTRFLDGAGSHGYPCRDQPGWAPGQVLTPVYEWNNVPVHIGTYDGGQGTPGGNAGLTPDFWMAENREYYNYSGNPNHANCNASGNCPFTGTGGVGSGRRADRPTVCTPGVGYFSVDQGAWNTTSDIHFKTTLDGVDYFNGVLDVCTATNTWTNAWYTPANFPAPLDIPVTPPLAISAGGRLRRR